MRRFSAILLVALFSFSLIGPAVFASETDSNLPECCRRAGIHHCATMAGQPESSSGPSMQAGKCPFFPVVSAVPVSRADSVPGVSHTIHTGFVSQPALRPQTIALCRASYSRADQKRGPPTSLA